MSDLISRCELFNRLATIPAPADANEFKAEIYKAIQSMETIDAVYFCNGEKCKRCSPECELTRDPKYAAFPDKAVIIDRCGYCMGASFNDCEECERRRIHEAKDATMEI